MNILSCFRMIYVSDKKGSKKIIINNNKNKGREKFE